MPKDTKASFVRLSRFETNDQRPTLALYLTDRAGKILNSSPINDQGEFKIDEALLGKAERVAVGPAEVEGQLDPDLAYQFRSAKFRDLLKQRLPIDIPRSAWLTWLTVTRCVEGRVRHCFHNLVLAQLSQQAAALELAPARLISGGRAHLADLNIAKRFPFFPYRCEPVCDGVVEVYRRVCCCSPFIIPDLRIPELVLDLERLIPDPPPDLRWPPRPGPDPFPPPFLKEGALDERVLNAKRDVVALRALSTREQVQYIQARPYLRWCSCGTPKKVATGSIDPGGNFDICWREPLTFLRPNCHIEYAFVVKQVINGVVTTIYNGLAAGQWYGHDDEVTLTSYHPRAIGCRHNDFPGEGAFVLLQDIGGTPSHHLKTPDASGPYSVQAPFAYNDGLVFPAANAAAAVGQYLDRNWGGTLALRYAFSEPMKAAGAVFYRLSVSAADANGNPTGTRRYLDGAVNWSYFEVNGSSIDVKVATLGPDPATGLFRIPYDADRDWFSGQYHGSFDTTSLPEGRYMLTVEVFNAAGQLLRPNGTADPGGSVAAGFTYRRWYQPVGPTAEVAHAALTHLFWVDNRPAVGRIVDLRVGGTPSSAECQFLSAAGNASFSCGYRAYHPNPMFLLNHSIWWRRGLAGASDSLESANPNNVGVPPAAPGQSNGHTFDHMLDLGNPVPPGVRHSKCAFALNLHVNVKTTNGSGTLDSLDAYDQAAFAIERT